MLKLALYENNLLTKLLRSYADGLSMLDRAEIDKCETLLWKLQEDLKEER